MSYEEVLDQEVERLKNKENVRAIAVVGSYARNPNQEHNDIDIYIIVDENWRKRENEEVDGILVERFYNSFERAKKYFDQDDPQWYMFHWMKNADIRYDPENLFEELKEYAEDKTNEKLKLNDLEKKKIRYSIWDYQQDLDTNDVGQKRYLMYQFFDYLIEKYYLMEEEMPVKYNYRIAKLREIDGYLYKLSQEFLTSSSTMEKERKLEKITDHVTRIIGDPIKEWETDKEEPN